MLINPLGLNDLTGAINGCAIAVHRVLGPGLLESAYRACLQTELAPAGRKVAVKVPIPLEYRGLRLKTTYYLDLVVDDVVIVEVKCVAALATIHTAQLLTYLRLTNRPVGLLINFNVPVLKQGIRRVLNSTPATSDVSASGP